MNWKFWKSKKAQPKEELVISDTFKLKVGSRYCVHLRGGLVTTDAKITECEITLNETRFKVLIGGKIQRWFTFKEFLTHYAIIWGELQGERCPDDVW